MQKCLKKKRKSKTEDVEEQFLANELKINCKYHDSGRTDMYFCAYALECKQMLNSAIQPRPSLTARPSRESLSSSS